jgi:acyl-coenzyme A synthetase/AMP-(fatty) acid ligase
MRDDDRRMPSLALALHETAVRYPDHPAVRLDDTILSYAQLVDSLPKGPTGKVMRRLVVAPEEMRAK